MSSEGVTYVGTLYAYQCEGEEPQRCARTVLGVDPDLGLVQAHTRPDLTAERYLTPPRYSRARKCVRLWYERRRVDFPNDHFWFHDLDDAHVFVAGVDNRACNPDRGIHTAPLAVITGEDVETCPDPPGDFLCG